MTLHTRLFRSNIIQMIAIALATLFGVFITATIMEQLLLRVALEGEADFYWASYEKDAQHPLPHTLHMIGYLHHHDPQQEAQLVSMRPHMQQHVPASLKDLPLGFHTIKIEGNHRLVHISQRHDQTLYLIIDEEQITELSFFFGVVPLVFSLGGLYLLSWLTQRLFRSTVSPITQLAHKLQNIDLHAIHDLELPQAVEFQDTEIAILYGHTQQLLNRVQESIDREKRFTRDASHELRTPLAVCLGSLDVIQKQINIMAPLLEQRQLDLINRSMDRAYRSSKNMQTLLSDLLLLAREDYQHVPSELVDCNSLVDTIASELQQTFKKQEVEIKVRHLAHWSIRAPKSVLRVVLTNIAANAMKYTKQGEVIISTWTHVFEIKDTGAGFNPEFLKTAFQPFSRGDHENAQGAGLGLSIVKRFCDHYGWTIEVENRPGAGALLRVTLAESQQR